jgi:alpha-galactosidase
MGQVLRTGLWFWRVTGTAVFSISTVTNDPSPEPEILRFPAEPADPSCTCLTLAPTADGLPLVGWLGTAAAAGAGLPAGTALLVEHSTNRFTRPGLRGYRIVAEPDGLRAGRDWSTAFRTTSIESEPTFLCIDAEDSNAGLQLRTEIEALPGGALRARHVLTNVGDSGYVVEGLEVTFPLPDANTELLDFTGRHERERIPQRRPLTDGLWLRESRAGKPGHDAASVVLAGTQGFTFTAGNVVGVSLAWSGNSVLRVERDGATAATIGGGELLLPGEIVLATGESYASPWLVVVAATDGLDGAAAALHAYERSLPTHPAEQPVTLNVWEAVYFDHDAARLTELAELAARVGVERFVLDDGWFHARRTDSAGLGDWWVDTTVWPDGLRPLADRVHALGMQFGLWFEPEMVNPDSDLYREHPDWILAPSGRVPRLQRDQLVLDLSNDEVFGYLLDHISTVLEAAHVDAVKWDHNRDLLEAGSSTHAGAPAVHEQTLAYYALLDELRARHPNIEWESCAGGGGRIDLGVLEHVERVWTSDMTDALSRQQIQRWTAQLVAPEYLGAHISAPESHQTGRRLSLDFRAATAMFGAFGIEWDLTRASDADLEALTEWVARYKTFRPMLHSGRMVRIDSSDPAVLMHGVVASDGTAALLAHVQMDESAHNRGVTMRVPGLRADAQFDLCWEGPVVSRPMSVAQPVDPYGPTGGALVSGRALAGGGVWIPRRMPETTLLVHFGAVAVSSRLSEHRNGGVSPRR